MGQLFNYLSHAPLDHLLVAAREGDSTDTPAMSEIIQRFEPLARKIAASFDAPHHLRDDLEDAARIGLVNAVRHHDGRDGFPAFAKVYMHGSALRELRRWTKPEDAHGDDLEEMFIAEIECSEIAAVDDRLAPWGGGHLAEVLGDLTYDQQVIIEMRYCEDLAIKEIAEEVGTSAPAVSQRLSTIHRRVALAVAA